MARMINPESTEDDGKVQLPGRSFACFSAMLRGIMG